MIAEYSLPIKAVHKDLETPALDNESVHVDSIQIITEPFSIAYLEADETEYGLNKEAGTVIGRLKGVFAIFESKDALAKLGISAETADKYCRDKEENSYYLDGELASILNLAKVISINVVNATIDLKADKTFCFEKEGFKFDLADHPEITTNINDESERAISDESEYISLEEYFSQKEAPDLD